MMRYKCNMIGEFRDLKTNAIAFSCALSHFFNNFAFFAFFVIFRIFGIFLLKFEKSFFLIFYYNSAKIHSK